MFSVAFEKRRLAVAIAVATLVLIVQTERTSSFLIPPALHTRHRTFARASKPNKGDVVAFLSKDGNVNGGQNTTKESSSSATTTVQESSIDGKYAQATAISREKAMASLEKLLARQKSEVLETERLLARFESAASDEELGLSVDGGSGGTLSVAASLASGFDYGFQSRSEGSTFDQLKGGSPGFHGPPGNILAIGSQQFVRNLKAIVGEYSNEKDIALTPKQIENQEKLKELTLNTTAIWEREGPIVAPYIIKIPYIVLCYFLDIVFEGKYVPARFFFLETVARMPYFSYISMLHLYETLGFWRRSADIKRIHFAEEINEFRHLLIMESLGGDQQWWVRFLAQHSAIAYYFVLCFLWATSPTLSYKFSELLETHAVHTYSQMLDENEEKLKQLPPSLAALECYSFGTADPFYAEFQTSALARGEEIRRPGEEMKSLYDVYSAVRDDESDHVSTMISCMDPDVAVNSPSIEKRIITGVVLASIATYALGATVGFDFLDPAATGDLEDLADLEGVAESTAIFDVGAVLGGLAGFVRSIFGNIQTNVDEESLEFGSEALRGEPLVEQFVSKIVEFFSRLL